MFGIGAGKVEIRIPKIAYVVGEPIEGTLVLLVNSPVKARGVFLKLCADQKYREYVYDSGSHHSHGFGQGNGHWTTTTKTVYNFVLQFDGEREYPKTPQPLVYPFRIFVPKEAETLRQYTGSSGLGSPVVSIGQLQIGGGDSMGGGPTGPPDWYLVGYLDLPFAFDVSTRVMLSI